MALRYLFIDFDSFFASVEQQLQPQLRGRPVGVVPSLGVETTCCIAASYEAKAFGVKTGTPVREARHLCPDIVFVEANHPAYVRMHSRIKALIHEILYVDAVLSIDEMYGRLPPHEQAPERARAKAEAIKAALAEDIGPHVRASIGLAPNRFLAKLASKMEKPDGLTCLDFEDLPHKISSLELEDLTGIGKGMLRRLRAARIHSVSQLCAASRRKLHSAWGSVEGDRMWSALRGIDLPAVETNRRTVGHSHVLPPRLRNTSGAHATLHRMLQKAGRRLRAMDHFTGQLVLQVKFGFELRWENVCSCFPTQNDVTLGKLMNQLWDERPREVPEPTKVGVMLLRLEAGRSHTPDLFAEPAEERRLALQQAMDQVNRRHGGRSLYYAEALEAQRDREVAPMRIAFNHIPGLELERD
jgi:DNA polymerase-4